MLVAVGLTPGGGHPLHPSNDDRVGRLHSFPQELGIGPTATNPVSCELTSEV